MILDRPPASKEQEVMTGKYYRTWREALVCTEPYSARLASKETAVCHKYTCRCSFSTIPWTRGRKRRVRAAN